MILSRDAKVVGSTPTRSRHEFFFPAFLFSFTSFYWCFSVKKFAWSTPGPIKFQYVTLHRLSAPGAASQQDILTK